ncbi:putative 3-methyladenine DNA glycosylase [Luteitalea sp. TBR-22]|uniref:DNA-3-methyladenine glycosylase n=1 Tax=Luteitalea sp. TBR-22 TaxID=2802971 RepID=UPI001AFCAB3C|nr:DNA-3-methyladenine glycosylase [Luteitalea sp. TBR-22]BCS34218.1 putative 3-methyladenine DNA glycosylase [Luteitalea sp. TBR-22]
MAPARPLPPSFYARPTLQVAADLIGMRLRHEAPDGTTAGLIVEVEAYIGEDDPACHAAPGPTRRNAPLYGPPGLAYVYFNYGMHWLVNAVTEADGAPAAVLIRALEPVEGLDLMRSRRAPHRAAGEGGFVGRDADLCRGPGNLTRALAITGMQNCQPLWEGALRIERPSRRPSRPVAWSPRIGIRVGQDRLWRAYVPGHPAVSGKPR